MGSEKEFPIPDPPVLDANKPLDQQNLIRGAEEQGQLSSRFPNTIRHYFWLKAVHFYASPFYLRYRIELVVGLLGDASFTGDWAIRFRLSSERFGADSSNHYVYSELSRSRLHRRKKPLSPVRCLISN